MIRNQLALKSFTSWFIYPSAPFLFAVLSAAAIAQDGNAVKEVTPKTLSVMTWNIWHGGREDGKEIGPKRVVDVIRTSQADLIAMQETYGSGELISKALGFHFQPRGTNVSIHSRYPVVEDISVFEEFKCVGALIELPDKQRIAFYSIWLPYNKEIWAEGTRDTDDSKSMIAACQASCDDLKKIKARINERLAGVAYQNIPVIIAGDFNSMSHLDYIPSFKNQFDVSIDWATSHVLTDDGFLDTYREQNPEVDRSFDRTWTPRFPKQEQDRIDFIYTRGELESIDSRVIDKSPDRFPSDHAAVLTQFAWPQPSATENNNPSLRVASYNIRHGAGVTLDLDRTAALLKNLRADIIGLQEVDKNTRRCGGVDQPKHLANELGVDHAFGKFMDYQDGEYGMAILSRFPILNSREVKLPLGNEPRVALACELKLASGQLITAVNVHFDWVRDDKFRLAQAKKLAEFLAKLKTPYILLGDFNDQKGSATLDLLSEGAIEATKPTDDHFTFSAQSPAIEIDFLFGAPASKWNVKRCKVFRATQTSDHRPVMAVFELNNE